MVRIGVCCDVSLICVSGCGIVVDADVGSMKLVRSVGIIVYGYAMFQKRLTMISARDAGQFGGSVSESDRMLIAVY